ncbi:DMT family transporter [Herbiconiux moechotypicola]|uniref:DMT family transporter n=1 Tax=Herbiconiux moechotypicola TaxID=637393 RepID=A0ABN3DNL2_9MICO|nr:DMT family transporter [Herbiconiux moechotypicola]MCS5730346.1 DMT family transporter [Herbiconiux moechotypicola]
MLPVLAVLLAAVCFGTTGTAQAFAPEGATPLAIGAARILVGGAVLAIIALAARRRPPTDGPMLPRPSGRQVVLVLVGAAGVLAYQPLFFAGTAANGVAIGTVVALGSAPVITGVLAGVLGRSLPSARWFAATAVATVGVVLISGVFDTAGPTSAGSAGGTSPLGLLASVGAGGSYAVYTLASKALLDQGWTPSSAMGALFGVAAVASIPLLLVAGAGWLLTPEGIGMTLWLGLVTTAGAYLLFGWGLARLPAATVSTLTLAEPLTATLLGTLLLGEQLAPLALAGLVVLGAGLVVLAWPASHKGTGTSRPVRTRSSAG